MDTSRVAQLPEGDLDWPVESVDETGVTELRVHGVGGTPPERLLGDPHPRQVTGAQLTDLPSEHRERFSVITYGNPVVNLYQQWFPAYVNRRLIETAAQVPSRWVNFFRYTDPVGRELFRMYPRRAGVRPPTEVTGERTDCWLPDPPTDLARPGDGPPVRRGHGQDGCLRQSAFRGYLAAEARRLARLTQPASRSGDPSRAELDTHPGPDRPGGLRDGVLPRPLAGTAHDDQVTVPEPEP